MVYSRNSFFFFLTNILVFIIFIAQEYFFSGTPGANYNALILSSEIRPHLIKFIGNNFVVCLAIEIRDTSYNKGVDTCPLTLSLDFVHDFAAQLINCVVSIPDSLFALSNCFSYKLIIIIFCDETIHAGLISANFGTNALFINDVCTAIYFVTRKRRQPS